MRQGYGYGSRNAALLLAAVSVFAPILGAQTQIADDDLRQLSLEELLQVEITSVSKKPETLAEAAAAVYVLSGEEIRRSGAASLAEALRLVPGLMVARTDAQTWAISARGFNSTTANKLEVLLDGRSLYTPLFSGVFWDVQDTLLADVERIEVIRGPGATLWGSNAVNGVINILTKSAHDTLGTLWTAAAGDELRASTAVRHGRELGNGGALRVWGKYFARDDSQRAGGADAADGWYLARAGFRFDRAAGDGSLTLQGDLYGGSLEAGGAPIESSIVDDTEVSGGFVLAGWQRPLAGGGEARLQAYYDRTHRDIPGVFAEDRDIVDVDYQRRRPIGGRHELIWGLSYRLSSDDVVNSEIISWTPPSRDLQLFSAFVQDEISFAGGRAALTLGSKFEHNDYTGFELQPSLRVRWRASERQVLWAAASRAVRTPNRLDRDIRLDAQLSADPPLFFALQGSDAFEAERVVAVEAGYRVRASATFSTDLAVFVNDYDRLQSIEGPGAPRLENGRVVVPFEFGNGLRGDSLGAEVTALWQPTPKWRLHAAWTALDLDLETAPGSNDTTSAAAEGNNPRHQIQLRWLWDAGDSWTVDGTLRWVDELPNLGVDDYEELDLRLAYRPNNRWSLALVGRNLLDRFHFEWGPQASAVERDVYVSATWSF